MICGREGDAGRGISSICGRGSDAGRSIWSICGRGSDAGRRIWSICGRRGCSVGDSGTCSSSSSSGWLAGAGSNREITLANSLVTLVLDFFFSFFFFSFSVEDFLILFVGGSFSLLPLGSLTACQRFSDVAHEVLWDHLL